jgi:hypothetical protein
MTYSIEHSCGHEQEHQLYGPQRERDRKLAWLATRPCTACWRAEQEREREAANAEAAEANDASGYAALEGSPRQIAWAESIRQAELDTISRRIAAADDHALGVFGAGRGCSIYTWGGLEDEGQAVAAIVADGYAALARELERQTSAAWWIDHRDNLDEAVEGLALPYSRLMPLADADRERLAAFVATLRERIASSIEVRWDGTRGVLTTEHSQSCNGQPVLVVAGEAYGPAECEGTVEFAARKLTGRKSELWNRWTELRRTAGCRA